MAHRPWLIAQVPAVAGSSEPQERIDQCLACTKPECTNCLGPTGGRKQRGRPPKLIDDALALRLYNHGYCDSKMAWALGVSSHRVVSWRRQRKLPHNPDKLYY